MPRASDLLANIQFKTQRGQEVTSADIEMLKTAVKQLEGQQMYGHTSSKFSGVLPLTVATTSTSVLGVSEHVSRADHQHGQGTHTHLDDTTGGTITAAAVSDFSEAVDDRVDALIVDGEGIDTTYDDVNGTLTIAGEDASDTNKGIASFASADFDVTTGAVALEDTVVMSVTADTGGALPATHIVQIAGGEGIDTTGSLPSNVITIAGENASDTNKGIASFSASDFTVTAGAVAIKANTYLLLDASNDPVTGDLLVKPTVDSLTGFVVQDTDANPVLTVDTINNRIGIGLAAPGNKLTVTAPTTADALADVMIGTSATTQKGLVIQAKASQTATLQEWQYSNGQIASSVSSVGSFGIGVATNATTKLNLSFSPTDGTVLNRGIYSVLAYTSNSNCSSSQRALDFLITTSGTGGASGSSIGVSGAVQNAQSTGTWATMAGCSLLAGNYGAGTVTNGIGVQNILVVNSTGSIVTGKDFVARAPTIASSGGVTTHYGYYAENLGQANTTNSYAIYLLSQSGSATGNFAIVTNAGNIVFNEGGDASTDFRVEGDTNANLLIVDGGEDVVSIGTTAAARSTHDGTLQVSPVAVTQPTATFYNATANYGIIVVNSVATGTASGGLITLRAAVTPSASGHRIGFLGAGAITTGTTYVQGAAITFHAAEAWDSTHAGSYITFNTAPTGGSTTRAEVLYLSNASVVFNDVSADCDFRIESNDEENMLFLDGGNNYLYLGGTTNGIRIDQGGELTLLGTATVFNDANVGSLVLQTGGTLPGVVEWLNNVGGATGIYGRGFAIGEQGSGSIEIPHDYDEGTDLTFHVHWGSNTAPSGTDYVKWQLQYSITRSETTFPASTTIVVETAYDTQYELKRSDFPAIVGTNFLIGDQVNFTLTRIAAVGDAFGGEALVETIGFHYAADTLGSKTIVTK